LYQDKGEEYSIPEFLLPETDKEHHKDTDESYDDSTQGIEIKTKPSLLIFGLVWMNE